MLNLYNSSWVLNVLFAKAFCNEDMAVEAHRTLDHTEGQGTFLLAVDTSSDDALAVAIAYVYVLLASIDHFVEE